MNTNLALGFLYSGDIWNEDTPYELHDVGYEMLAELKDKDLVEVVRCKDCKHSIKKDYDVLVSYEYLCILKSTTTHLEEHEATYFCADGKRRDTNECK